MVGKDLIRIIEENNLFGVHISDCEDIVFDLSEHKTNRKDRGGEDVIEYVDFVIDTHTGETSLNTWYSDK